MAEQPTHGEKLPDYLDSFLAAFFPDECESINFRAFKAKGAAGSLLNKPAKFSATRQNIRSERNIEKLIDLNIHHGLYFVVNSGGDKDEEITRFNAFYCECDDLPILEQHKLLDAAPVQPSIRIETAKSVHAYWLLQSYCTEQEWREVQNRLIGYFKSDPKIKNPSRVMRLPFFNHLSLNADGSYQYKPVEIIRFEPERRFTVAEMLQAFSTTNAETSTEANHITGYQSWDALWAEWGNRLRQHPSAKQNSAGNWDCRGICHNGKGDSGLVYFPSTNRGHCNSGCHESTVLQAFRLPDKPTGVASSIGQQLTIDTLLEPLANLSKESTPDDIEAAIRHIASQLVSCDALKKELVRDAAMKKLREIGVSSPARMLDAALPKDIAPDEEDSKSLNLKEPELWHEAVDGSQLFNELVRTLQRFLSAKDDLYIAVSLWVLYAHAFDAFFVSPLLAITSPEKRCGKTTLLTLLDALVPKPLSVSNITSSALFRTIEKCCPTLLIDEADTFLTNDEMLRGILNSGNTRNAAYVIRTVGEGFEPQKFTTWSPKVIAMIGALPSTVEDRAIIIRMERKQAKEVKEKVRLDRMAEFEELRQKATRWAADHFEQLRLIDPVVPSEITNDRARDNWRVLLSIAEVIGGEWSERARQVAYRLAGIEPASESPRALLLQDLKTIFDEKGEVLSSEEIITSLHEMENRSWAEWKNGKPLSKIGLARMLKSFGIEPDKWRDDTKTVRGYQKGQFAEAFSRYIDSESPQSPQSLESMTYKEKESPQENLPVASANNPKLHKTNAVASVASPKESISKPALSWGEV